MPGELEDLRVVPDVIAVALEDHALEVVVEDLARDSAERVEGIDVPAQETLELLLPEELGVHRPRPSQHHHEARQLAPRLSDVAFAEAAPVDLGLLAGQRPQTQVSLLLPLRADLADVAPHLGTSRGSPERGSSPADVSLAASDISPASRR